MELYRDDDLIIIRNPNGLKLDSYRKGISNTLKLLGFKITIHTNLKIVDFLDVTLNLSKGTFEPYKKENDTPIYIHTCLNYPPSVIKQIPKSISYRLFNNSSNIRISNKYKHIYYNALKYSSYRQTLEYTPPKGKLKHRSRNITWFNLPYNKCITSNIARYFLNLITKHFPNHSPLSIWSATVAQTTSQIIKNLNKKIKSIHSTMHSTNQCNCRVKNTCPLLGKWLHKNIVYKTTPKTNSSVNSSIAHRCNGGNHKTRNIQPQAFFYKQKLLI